MRGIDPPDGGCFQALGPAEAKIVLGERRGTFGLRFEHGGEADRFEVRVVSDSAVVTPKGGTFVRYAPLAAYYPRY